MQIYIGLHAGYGDLHIQCVRAHSGEEAFDIMERNDTNLIVMSQKQFDVIKSLDYKELAKKGKMVLIGNTTYTELIR
jgi:hypothetical protein